MTSDEKLDKILSLLGAAPEPADFFVRPDPVEPRYGEGIPMTTPDVREALKRSLYGVTPAGNVARFGKDYDDVWAEIEALKAAGQFDPIVEPYLALIPETAFFGLLTGRIGLPKWDGLGMDRRAQRMGLAGKSVADLLDEHFHGGTPSGR